MLIVGHYVIVIWDNRSKRAGGYKVVAFYKLGFSKHNPLYEENLFDI